MPLTDTGEHVINSIEEEYAFAKDSKAQFALLQEAFSTGDDEKIDQALLTVTYARDNLRNGILEMLRDHVRQESKNS